MEHSLHLILIILPTLLVVFFTSPKKVKTSSLNKLGFLIIVFFLFFHVIPTNLIIALHHQSEAHSIKDHPCCLPQAATTTPKVSMDATVIVLRPVHEINHSFQDFPEVLSISIRSPPSTS